METQELTTPEFYEMMKDKKQYKLNSRCNKFIV